MEPTTLCIPSYDQFATLTGENFVNNYLIIELLKRGCRIHLVCLNRKAEEDAKKRYPGITTSSISMDIKRFTVSRLFKFLFFSYRAAREMGKHDADIWFGHHFPNALAVRLAKVRGKKHVGFDDIWSEYWLYSHHGGSGHLIYSILRNLESYICRGVDSLHTTTQVHKAMLVARGAKAGAVSVVGLGTDTNIFRPEAIDKAVLAEFGLKEDDILVTFQGGIKRYDGVDLLIEASTLIAGKHPRARFLIAGSGQRMGALKTKVVRLGMEGKFIFTGWVNQAKLASLLAASTVNVVPLLPSRATQGVLPGKLVEAMSAGVPTVTSDLPGMREIVRDGETAVLFEPGNKEALAAAVDRLLTDRKLRNSIRRKALLAIKGSGWDSYAERLADILLNQT